MLIKQNKKFALIQTNIATCPQSLNKSTSTLHNGKKGENYRTSTTIQLSILSQSHSAHEPNSPKKKRKGVWVFKRNIERLEPINRPPFESCSSAVVVAPSTIVHDFTGSDGIDTRTAAPGSRGCRAFVTH